MTATIEHTSGIKALVPEGWYLVSDAALLVGKSSDTLTKWRRDGVFTPEGHMEVGELTVFLYSNKDIEALKRLARTRRPGRKPRDN